jgi:hypothetical protein
MPAGLRPVQLAPTHAAQRRAGRLLLALLVSSCVFGALFYFYPSRYLFRGVAALTVVLAVCGVVTSRLVFARMTRRKP